MKKTILLVLLLMIHASIFAPAETFLVIPTSAPVNEYDILLRAITQVESKGDTLAYNPFEDAYGPLQIRPVRLLDYNIRTGKNYMLKDCYRPGVSREIFMYYANLIGPDFEIIAKRWNGSGEKTIEYWKKVKAIL